LRLRRYAPSSHIQKLLFCNHVLTSNRFKGHIVNANGVISDTSSAVARRTDHGATLVA
jgi:hypothetical protein